MAREKPEDGNGAEGRGVVVSVARGAFASCRVLESIERRPVISVASSAAMSGRQQLVPVLRFRTPVIRVV